MEGCVRRDVPVHVFIASYNLDRVFLVGTN